MKLTINGFEEFEGTEMECMDYACNDLHMTDDAFSDLFGDGSAEYRGQIIESFESEEVTA